MVRFYIAGVVVLVVGFISFNEAPAVCNEIEHGDKESIEEVGRALGNSDTANAFLSNISEQEWKKSAKVWIARAMVSEAGWDERNDHVAIAYVLFRRWIQVKRRYPKYPMRAVVAKYCAGFGKTIYSARQKWVKNLNEDGTRPIGWPNDIAWSDYKERWLSVLETAEEWNRGLHPDPCRGLSRYWGGPMDRPSKRMIRMDCGETKNYFYTVRTLLPEATLNIRDSK